MTGVQTVPLPIFASSSSRQAIDDEVEWQDTFPLKGTDGTFRWFLSLAVPVRENGGPIVRWYGTHADVTEQRELEASLRQSEQRFRALVEASAAVIWTTTAEGELLPPQPRWSSYTGQGNDEFRGRGWIDAIPPDDRSRAADVWTSSVEEVVPS